MSSSLESEALLIGGIVAKRREPIQADPHSRFVNLPDEDRPAIGLELAHSLGWHDVLNTRLRTRAPTVQITNANGWLEISAAGPVEIDVHVDEARLRERLSFATDDERRAAAAHIDRLSFAKLASQPNAGGGT